MTDDARDPVTIALQIDDPALADRVAALLGGIAGVRLVTHGEPADLVLASGSKSIDTVAVADELSDADAGAILTPREREVLMLLAEGASNKAIARRLGISVHTAKFHVGSLIDKLDASGRTDAVTHAARRGVIEL